MMRSCQAHVTWHSTQQSLLVQEKQVQSLIITATGSIIYKWGIASQGHGTISGASKDDRRVCVKRKLRGVTESAACLPYSHYR